MELEPLTISPPPLSVDWQYHLAFRRELLVRCPELPTPKYLLAPEIRALAALPINQHHRMLLLLLFNTGGRISEVLCLTPNDVLRHKGRTVIKMRTLKQQRSKQGRPKEGLVRLVTLYDDQFANTLEGYIVTHCSNKKLPIFRTQQKNSQTGQRDRPVNSETARNWLKKIERIAHKNGLDVLLPLTPKVLRHSAAVHLILNRMPVKMVQKFLGHKSIQSTEVYTDLLAVDMSYDVQIKF
ncbi:tyrosine-type recombinase/integrase [Vibrio ostreicida]|uniref:tyrosine-type recombinase/integrase n=1 Tax=Vibrio ostreicida TaxID=526588 RepID=UPI003B5A2B26